MQVDEGGHGRVSVEDGRTQGVGEPGTRAQRGARIEVTGAR